MDPEIVTAIVLGVQSQTGADGLPEIVSVFSLEDDIRFITDGAPPEIRYTINDPDSFLLPRVDLDSTNISSIFFTDDFGFDPNSLQLFFGEIRSPHGSTTVFVLAQVLSSTFSQGHIIPIAGDELPDVSTVERLEQFLDVATFSASTGAFGEGQTISVTSVIDDGATPPEEPDEPEVPTSGDDQVDGTAAADAIDGLAGDDVIAGLAGNDLLTGRGGSDTLSGGRGADTLIGGGGKDELTGGGGKDLLRGNGGKDTLSGNGGKDTLEGGGARDHLLGGGGKDRLEGGGGKDTLEGGGGRDEIVGGGGADVLTGNGGADRFIFDRGNGRDTITDFQQNRDKIVVEGGAEAFDDLAITQVGDDVLIRIANTRVTVEDAQVEAFTESDFIF